MPITHRLLSVRMHKHMHTRLGNYEKGTMI